MFRCILFILITICVHVSQTYAQTTTLFKDEIKRMVSTYTYYVVQNITLEVLAVKYPRLSKYTKDATRDWNREFLISIQAIDSLLTDSLKDTWITEKKKIIYKYSGTDYSSITESEAQQYINLVFQRSVGKMQSPILETLLIYKPGYLDLPEREFSDGYINSFHTKDLKRPLKINLKVLCPRTWLDTENITKSGYSRKYTSNFGKGNVSLTVSIESNRKELSPENCVKNISETILKNMLDKSEAYIAYSAEMKIDNLPTGTIVFQKPSKTLSNIEYMLCENYHAYYKNFHITLAFAYTSQKNFEETIVIKEKYHRLVRKIVSNIVLLSQWEQKKHKK